jgi:hypothetical protein
MKKNRTGGLRILERIRLAFMGYFDEKMFDSLHSKRIVGKVS